MYLNGKKILTVNKSGGIKQVQSDWNQTDTDAVDYIKNKPDLDDKQDKLTAGNNITISEDNVISASGGGSEPEYLHCVYFGNEANVDYAPFQYYLYLVTTKSTPYTTDELKTYLNSAITTSAGRYPNLVGNGMYYDYTNNKKYCIKNAWIYDTGSSKGIGYNYFINDTVADGTGFLISSLTVVTDAVFPI